MDRMRLDALRPEPTRKPETVATGLVGNNDTRDRVARPHRLAAPALEQRQQGVLVGLQLLQRPATAAAICTVLDLLVTGQLPQSGFVRQEEIPLKIFLENRFGQVCARRRVFRISVSEAQDDDERFLGPTHIGS